MPDQQDDAPDNQLEAAFESAIAEDQAKAEEAAVDTADFALLGNPAQANAGGEETLDEESESEQETQTGPGFFRRAFAWLWKWHPLMFLGAAAATALIAWSVYPEQEEQNVPPARELYEEGIDRLYRVMNPDLPLRAATPVEEALSARNALLNLFIFHRGDLKNYPEFINPHLLLGEADYRIAQNSPELAQKHYSDALQAFDDAAMWESREDDPKNLALYAKYNYLFDSPGLPDDSDWLRILDYFDEHEDEIAMRRKRRDDFIRFRQAEADLRLGRPDLALPILEQTAEEVRTRRRDQVHNVILGENSEADPRPHAFELGHDEYLRLPLLLGMAYDQMGQIDKARSEYRTYLGSERDNKERVFVLERLGRIAMEDGRVYSDVDPKTTEKAYQDAASFYDEIAASPDSTPEQRNAAILESAKAYSALAGLDPEVAKSLVDSFADAGATVRSWLESFAGQSLPARTLALPLAFGHALTDANTLAPSPLALPAVAAGEFSAMAGGDRQTPYAKRRALLDSAIDRYDRIAAENAGTELAEQAMVMAARESLNLGLTREAETRFKNLLDPLLSSATHLAARLSLAEIYLARGDLDQAAMLVLGGRAHPMPLWLSSDDADWRRIAARLGNPANRSEKNIWSRIWEMLMPEGKEIASYAAAGRQLDNVMVSRFLKSLNSLLRRKDFYDPAYFADLTPGPDLAYLLEKNPETYLPQDVIWRNRLLLETSWPYELQAKAMRSNLHFQPFPGYEQLAPTGLTPPGPVVSFLTRLARAWAGRAANATDRGEKLRALLESAAAYDSAINAYHADPGEFLPGLAAVYEQQAGIREDQGNHREALSLTAKAARTYLAVASRARGAAREMESLLAAADAFFRAGLLERSIEALNMFMERYGFIAPAGSETSMLVARADNLLGRSYWFLGDSAKAIEAFTRNIKRRTPERYKSIYYIGRAMMDQADQPGGDPALLGSPDRPLPALDADGDPIIESAMQAFNYVKQDPGINPNARAWRWSAFDSARLAYMLAERTRKEAEQAAAAAPDAGAATAEQEEPAAPPWLRLYDEARLLLTEALERYPLRSNGGPGLSVRVEPEDYADLMAARFETEYLLASTLLQLADQRNDPALAALARAHLANLADREKYAEALFNSDLDRFQLNAAVIREAIGLGAWDKSSRLPRTTLGDDEGPTHSPRHLRSLLRNAMLLLAGEYYRAAEQAAALGDAGKADAADLYRQAYDAYQALYDRFGPAYGPQAMLGMADALNRLGLQEAAANHYRMAENIAKMQPDNLKADGLLDIGPGFWAQQASNRLKDQADGYRVP